MDLIVTNHAATRYAERVADKATIADINAYVVSNKEAIETSIGAMLEHSELIYSGKVGSKDSTNVNVYLCGTWILLLDQSKNKVITIYKVDLKVGEDFNKQFVERNVERTNACRRELEEAKKETAEEKSAYQKIIEENNALIAEYRTGIKNLEQINKDYKDIIDRIGLRYASAEMSLRKAVEDLCMKKEF